MWYWTKVHLASLKHTTSPCDLDRRKVMCAEVQVKDKQGWASLHAFQLDRESDLPLFRQLYLQTRAAILSRALRPGSKLPSTRELAAQLKISRSAVVSAYEQLLAEGCTIGRK